MPKKFGGGNSKAMAAKAAKAEKAEVEKQRKLAAEEDAKWADDDKHILKKQNRKEEAERKRLEAVEKKRETDRMLAEEESSIKGKVTAGSAKAKTKMTRAMIEQAHAAAAAKAKAAAKAEAAEPDTHLTKDIEENINRMDIHEGGARNVEEAIAVLSQAEKSDKHPEKRMKAAYEDFEKERLPELKAENPNLRLSQLKQMLRKEWMKSPKNPFNQIS